MSHPTESELHQLGFVAEEIREALNERGFHVEQALEKDPAFGNGSRGALLRELVTDAASTGASQAGVDFRPVHGSGREFRFTTATTDRRYRLRRAQRLANGDICVRASVDSSLASTEISLFDEESWIFGWILRSDGLLGEAFVAEIMGWVDGRPGHLILGPPISLVTSDSEPPRRGFQPTDEELDGFDDEDFGDETGSSPA